MWARAPSLLALYGRHCPLALCSAWVGEVKYSLRREGAEGELIELFVTEWPQSIDYCSGSSLEQRNGSMGEAARQIEATLCTTCHPQ